MDGGGCNSQDGAWAALGESPLSKPVANAAKQVSDGFNKTAQVVDKEIADPTNYLPFGVFAKAGSKASKLVKVEKHADLLKAIDRERALAKKANWKKADGSIWWPDNKKGYDKIPGSLVKHHYKPGDQFSRYSSREPIFDFGTYVSPVNTTFEQRAMYGKKSDYTERVFRVKKEIDTNRSTITPWFDQPGLGKQDQLSRSIRELIRNNEIEYIGVKK